MDVEDTLEHEPLVTALLVQVKQHYGDAAGAQVVAVVGPWGSGKTWVLEQLRPRLTGVARSFNPWLFGDELALHRGFASLII